MPVLSGRQLFCSHSNETGKVALEEGERAVLSIVTEKREGGNEAEHELLAAGDWLKGICEGHLTLCSRVYN